MLKEASNFAEALITVFALVLEFFIRIRFRVTTVVGESRSITDELSCCRVVPHKHVKNGNTELLHVINNHQIHISSAAFGTYDVFLIYYRLKFTDLFTK